MAVRIIFVFFLLLVIYVANAFANPFPLRLRSGSSTAPESIVRYGFSYSFEQAQWYGLDPRNSYVELLDMGFDWVRLPFFWDQMADDSGNLKIDDLEFAIEEAAKRDVKVVIVLGAKTPYYPEYHLPAYVKEQLTFGDMITPSHPIADDILDIDKKVVEKLYKYENIAYWQVENEPLLANINNWKFDKEFLKLEVETVRSTDPKSRPIMLTTASHPAFDKRYRALLGILKPGDVLGTSAYFKVEGVYLFAFSFLGKDVVVPWPNWLVWPAQSWLFLSPNYGSIAKEASANGIDFWVEEMQSEPYIRDLEEAKSTNFSFSAQDIVKAEQFLRSTGVKNIGFWGVHFWQYRQKLGDESWIESVEPLLQ